MELRISPIQIDPDNPFEKDLLNRKEEIENLSNLILAINSPAVLAVNSPWGTGKSTFIKMWQGYLDKKEIPSLYFNAWETDFCADPLIAFLGEMNDGLENYLGNTKPSRELWKKTKKVGAQIAKHSVPALVRVLTKDIVDLEKATEAELSKIMGAISGDVLETYLKQKSAITNFQELLGEIVEKSSNKLPIIIFVDELDRCRPSYAIALLERIKHLFNIEGLVFVLALDKPQLAHSICALYGNEFDSSGYLRRFIDFEYELVRPQIDQYVNSLFDRFPLKGLFSERKKYRNFEYDERHLKNTFLLLCSCMNLSFREIEQLLGSINLIICATERSHYIFPSLLVFLVVTKNKNREIYEEFINKLGNEINIYEYLYSIIPESIRLENRECAIIEGKLIAIQTDRWDVENFFRYKHHLGIINVNSENEVDFNSAEQAYSRKVIHVVNATFNEVDKIDLSFILNKINFVDQFNFDLENH